MQQIDPTAYRAILDRLTQIWPARRSRRTAKRWSSEPQHVFEIEAVHQGVSPVLFWLNDQKVRHFVEPYGRTLYVEIEDENRALEFFLAFGGQ